MIIGLINTEYNTNTQLQKLGKTDRNVFVDENSNADCIIKEISPEDTLTATGIQSLELQDSPASDTYQKIFNTGADIIILSSPTLSSKIFKKTLIEKTKNASVKETDLIISAVTDILTQQIENELEKARHITTPTKGSKKGNTYFTKKEKNALLYMKKNLKIFGGNMTDPEAIEALKISRNTFYKYKKKLKDEIQG